MIAPRLQRQLTDPFRKRINRAPSPIIARSVPWLTVCLGSIAPTLPTISSAPLLPPLGFLILLAWRQTRPGLLPVWAGAILGLVDDLFSGQPLGSAVLTWSLAMFAIEVIEARIPWRNFALNWLEAAGIITAYILLSLAFSNAAGGMTSVGVVVPQLFMSILLYPLAGRLVWLFDRARLLPFKVLG